MVSVVLQGLPGGGDLLGSLAQVAVLGGTLVLVLALVAFGAFVYKSTRGGGIEWPDDVDEESGDDGVSRGGDDDEWDYY